MLSALPIANELAYCLPVMPAALLHMRCRLPVYIMILCAVHIRGKGPLGFYQQMFKSK